MKTLVTGGAGFIGSNLVRLLLGMGHEVVNVDALTYAGSTWSLKGLENHPRHRFVKADIGDELCMRDILSEHGPEWIMNLAAESHVDRSICDPKIFVQTNVMGTLNMLQVANSYRLGLTGSTQKNFRFLQVSTDEVFGSLGRTGRFSEESKYDPRSPYSASKACGDHLARVWFHTYGLPVIVTNCSNNYGPYQFPEKLIPVVILEALRGNPIPVYGNGENVRDWLYVSDHAEALCAVIERGRPGESYNIGANNELRNLDLVMMLCGILDELNPRPDGKSYAEQVKFVDDRPGHDFRYAMDSSKIASEIGWKPRQDHGSGFKKTVLWYLDNMEWVEKVLGQSS